MWWILGADVKLKLLDISEDYIAQNVLYIAQNVVSLVPVGLMSL